MHLDAIGPNYALCAAVMCTVDDCFTKLCQQCSSIHAWRESLHVPDALLRATAKGSCDRQSTLFNNHTRRSPHLHLANLIRGFWQQVWTHRRKESKRVQNGMNAKCKALRGPTPPNPQTNLLMFPALVSRWPSKQKSGWKVAHKSSKNSWSTAPQNSKQKACASGLQFLQTCSRDQKKNTEMGDPLTK